MSRISPAAAAAASDSRAALTLPNAKPASNSLASQRSVSRVHSISAGCGGSATPLVTAHKPAISSPS